MAGYVHREERERAAAARRASVRAELQESLIAKAADGILAHRERLEAGVPGCTCGGSFSGYATMPAEHARHLAEHIVPQIVASLLAGASEPPARVPITT